MLAEIRRSYAQLKRSRPGKRFQELHERRAQGSRARRISMMTAGILSIAVGIALLIFPGPGIPFLILGFGLIGQELCVVARFLDRSEVKLRDYARRWAKWRRSRASGARREKRRARSPRARRTARH